MDAQRLNDLVFVKYNRTLKRRYDARDRVDPISLEGIDASNEWLIGRPEDEQDDDDLVFEDEPLTWDTVARASGAEEPERLTRSIRQKDKGKASSSKVPSHRRLINESSGEEEEREDGEGNTVPFQYSKLFDYEIDEDEDLDLDLDDE